jgi:hypothetical protein
LLKQRIYQVTRKLSIFGACDGVHGNSCYQKDITNSDVENVAESYAFIRDG